MDTHTEKITSKPRVSVCMVTYNRAGFLPEAIESVQAQTSSDWEMIIVDDVSTDDTRSVVEAYCANDKRIRYYRNERHLKISASRNYSLSLAQGMYVAILDSDDAWCDKDKLSKQYAFLESHPDHSLIGGGVVIVDENGREKKRYMNPASDAAVRRQIYWRNPFAHSSVMYRLKTVLGLGGYDESLETGEDYDLFLRIGSCAKFANLPAYVLYYRVHSGNITRTDRLRTMENNVRLMQKYRGNYPGYRLAMLRRTLRLWAYRLLARVL